MPRYERKDHYYQRAKREGHASRAVFKLEEMQRRFRLIGPGDRVADLGCAPGGWLQPLAQWVGPTGRVVGIDIAPMTIPLAPQVTCLQQDIATVHPAQLIGILGGPAQVVVSDMAPHTSGTRFVDQLRSVTLARLAWGCAAKILAPGGHFVVKVFEGPEVADFRKTLQSHFAQIRTIDPEASRQGSFERYFVCLSFA